MTATPTRLVTAEELWEMPRERTKYELSQGALIEMAPAAWNSGRFAGRVYAPMMAFVRSHDLGDCGVPESGFLLGRDPDTVREPDVWFLRKERLPDAAAARRFYEGAPDLAVEIASPSDRYLSLLRKVQEYLAAGTRLVWVLLPETETAAVYRPDGSHTLIPAGGTLSGEDVIPGFSLRLAEVFS